MPDLGLIIMSRLNQNNKEGDVLWRHLLYNKHDKISLIYILPMI